jgi:hypothetical protein
MSTGTRLSWGRIVLAVVAAEALPILALVAVVMVYGMARDVNSPTPEEFAPIAGKWVGPIGGFLATLVLSRWGARRAASRPLAHGLAIGVGTALLDLVLGIALGGGAAIGPLFLVSNGGRVTAGLLGGWLVARRGNSAGTV